MAEVTPTIIAGLILLALLAAGFGVFVRSVLRGDTPEEPSAEPDAAEELARERGELCLQPSWTDDRLRCLRPSGHSGMHSARGMEWVNRDPLEGSE